MSFYYNTMSIHFYIHKSLHFFVISQILYKPSQLNLWFEKILLHDAQFKIHKSQLDKLLC